MLCLLWGLVLAGFKSRCGLKGSGSCLAGFLSLVGLYRWWFSMAGFCSPVGLDRWGIKGAGLLVSRALDRSGVEACWSYGLRGFNGHWGSSRWVPVHRGFILAGLINIAGFKWLRGFGSSGFVSWLSYASSGFMASSGLGGGWSGGEEGGDLPPYLAGGAPHGVGESCAPPSVRGGPSWSSSLVGASTAWGPQWTSVGRATPLVGDRPQHVVLSAHSGVAAESVQGTYPAVGEPCTGGREGGGADLAGFWAQDTVQGSSPLLVYGPPSRSASGSWGRAICVTETCDFGTVGT